MELGTNAASLGGVLTEEVGDKSPRLLRLLQLLAQHHARGDDGRQNGKWLAQFTADDEAAAQPWIVPPSIDGLCEGPGPETGEAGLGDKTSPPYNKRKTKELVGGP